MSVFIKLIESQYQIILESNSNHLSSVTATSSIAVTDSNAHSSNSNSNSNSIAGVDMNEQQSEKDEVVVDIKSLLDIAMKVSISAFDCLIMFCRVIPTPVWKELTCHETHFFQLFILFLCKSVTLSSPWLATPASDCSMGSVGTAASATTEQQASNHAVSAMTDESPAVGHHDSKETAAVVWSLFHEVFAAINQISTCALECMSLLAVKDNEVYNDHPELLSVNNSNGYILSVKYNALLSNAVVRELESVHTSYIAPVTPTQPLLLSSPLQSHSSPPAILSNSHLSSCHIMSIVLLMINTCLGCIIDLHSSDHVGILQNYQNLRIHQKVQFYLHAFQSYYRAFNISHIISI
jgi:hypothetical protein